MCICYVECRRNIRKVAVIRKNRSSGEAGFYASSLFVI